MRGKILEGRGGHIFETMREDLKLYLKSGSYRSETSFRHICFVLPGAQLVLEAERQRLAEAWEEGEDSSKKNPLTLTNNEMQYVVHLLAKEEK